MIDRQTNVVDRADLGADDTENDIEPEALADNRGAESPLTIVVSEIDVSFFIEPFPFGFTEKGFCQFECFRFGERFVVIPDRQQLSIASPSWRKCCGEVNIGAAVFLAEAKVLIDVIKDSVGHVDFMRDR